MLQNWPTEGVATQKVRALKSHYPIWGQQSYTASAVVLAETVDVPPMASWPPGSERPDAPPVTPDASVLRLPTEARLGLTSLSSRVFGLTVEAGLHGPSREEIWKRWSLGFMPLTCNKSCSKRARWIWRSQPPVSAFRSSWRKSQLVWDLKEDWGATGQGAFWAGEALPVAFTT